jgi:hypothetical protein
MRFAKIVFGIAGIYGLILMTPLYFLEGAIGRQTPPAITHPEYFYGFIGVTVAWQLLFLALSTDPVRYRPMVLPSIVEKATYGIAVAVLFSEGRIAPAVVFFGGVDSLLGVLFIAAYFKTSPATASA